MFWAKKEVGKGLFFGFLEWGKVLQIPKNGDFY